MRSFMGRAQHGPSGPASGCLVEDPEILLNDYPPDIQARFGPMSERSKWQPIQVAVLMGVVTLVIVTASISTIRTNGGGKIPFRTAFVHLFVMFSVFPWSTCC
jgi:hypothetical protein